MVNDLVEFVPELSTMGQPLYEMLKAKAEWLYHPCTQLLRLYQAYWSVSRRQKLRASRHPTPKAQGPLEARGLYCPSHLSDAEMRYAEKECLASVWACESFDKNLFGFDNFRVVTDHKHLVPLGQ